jgi:hypothetical protein
MADQIQIGWHTTLSAITILQRPGSSQAVFDLPSWAIIACSAGATPFASFTELELADYRSGLADKLLGQIERVRQGCQHVHAGGSFTLISGILGDARRQGCSPLDGTSSRVVDSSGM